MSDVKWIKIVTDIFDDEKIKYIETMPNGDTTIVLWFRLLCLAGRSNRDGLLMMTDRIHYTDEMLASIFKRDVKTIQLALNIFENLGMIEIINQNAIAISKWEKHQSIDKLEMLREKTRKRVEKHRQNQLSNDCNAVCNVTSNANVTPCNATDIELELDKDNKNKKNNKDICVFDEYSGGNIQLKTALSEYEKMRNLKKWNMTDHSRKLLCRELDKLKDQGYDRVELLNTAILNNWKSVYAPKDQKRRVEGIPDYTQTAPALSEEQIRDLKRRFTRNKED